MSPVRVLHVDPERAWGGGEVQVVALARALAAAGHASDVAADPAGALAPAVRAAGLPVFPLRIANHADVGAGLRLRGLARDYDVVHFHTARAHAMAPFVGRRGRRLVVTRRMDYVPIGGLYARWLYNRCVDVVIAISAGVRAALVRGGVEPGRITVVASGVDPEAFAAPPDARRALRQAWGVPPAGVLVLVVGALERRKGQAVLLEAARHLASSEPAVHYVFCGAGSAAEALAAAAAPLGDAVRFAGFRADVAACLAAADVVAMPSLQEGLGVAALEAMAAGKPVVASRVGGLVEAVADGDTGVLVPPGDPAALAAALAMLAHDVGLRERLGAAGRARVLARYTSARMAADTLACYGRRQ